MDLSLAGRHALVCGASQGIGRAAALELAGLGATVTVLARSADKLNSVVAELLERGAPAAFALPADLDDHTSLVERVQAHLAAHGPVHVWVNNTGGPPGGPLRAAEPSAITAAIHRHVVGSQTLLRLLLPGMEDAGYGRIVNVLSTSVREPIPNLGVSNLTRAAMASWAKTLSRELAPGVTINNVLPGFTNTPRLHSLAEARAARSNTSVEAVFDAWLAMTPEGRLGETSDLAGAIAFLCSPAGGFIRGVTLPVDGGRLKSI